MTRSFIGPQPRMQNVCAVGTQPRAPEISCHPAQTSGGPSGPGQGRAGRRLCGRSLALPGRLWEAGERGREQSLGRGELARGCTSSTFSPSAQPPWPEGQGAPASWWLQHGGRCRQEPRCWEVESQGQETLPKPSLPTRPWRAVCAKAQPSSSERARDLGHQAEGRDGNPSLLDNPADRHRHGSHFSCTRCAPDAAPGAAERASRDFCGTPRRGARPPISGCRS